MLGTDYNASNGDTQLNYPGGVSFLHQHDGAGRLKAILENGATTVADFNYDALGRRSDATIGGAVVSDEYDDISRLSILTNNLAGTAADQTLTFGYNPASQIITRIESNDAYKNTTLGWRRSQLQRQWTEPVHERRGYHAHLRFEWQPDLGRHDELRLRRGEPPGVRERWHEDADL